MSIQIRTFHEKDAEATAYIINQDLLYSDRKSYFKKERAVFTKICGKEQVLKISAYTHMYVAYSDKKLVGCGFITNCCNREDTTLLTTFVLPEHQGQGFGREIIEVLEQDSYYKKANQIEIPLSLEADKFYGKIGYDTWDIEEKELITA